MSEENRIGTYQFVAEPFHVDFNGRLTILERVFGSRKPFPFPFKTFIDNISYDGVEDGVT